MTEPLCDAYEPGNQPTQISPKPCVSEWTHARICLNGDRYFSTARMYKDYCDRQPTEND